ncbi:hypothetical protein FGB62_87g097 [Gracilaria domingensis]|nr:hypothetical protein FGB62_87g097 [Gracilaria domingensis]
MEDPLLAGLSRLSTSHKTRQRASDPPRAGASASRPAPQSAHAPQLIEAAPAPDHRRPRQHPSSTHSRQGSQLIIPTTSGGYAAHRPYADKNSSPSPHQLSRKRNISDSSSRHTSSTSFPHRRSSSDQWTKQPSIPSVTPLTPLHRSEICELIERTTGLGRPTDGDPSVADQLLQLIKTGSVPPRLICEYVVAGSGPNEVKVNARALWLMHYLMVEGGPLVLPDVVHSSDGRNPPAVKLVLNVLRSFGYETDAEGLDVLQDDEKLRTISYPPDKQIPADALQKSKGERTYDAAAVETYAIALGRKAWFHYRYPVVEVNYSLDRFYRAWHVENDCDPMMHARNEEVVKLTRSKGALQDMCLLACAMTAAAHRLQRGKVATSICLQALGDACNAYSYALYLRARVDNRDTEDLDLERQREVLAGLVKRWEQRGGRHFERLQRYVDERVYDLIMKRSSVGVRPESRHRREIEIEVTSFEALHKSFLYLRDRNKFGAG